MGPAAARQRGQCLIRVPHETSNLSREERDHAGYRNAKAPPLAGPWRTWARSSRSIPKGWPANAPEPNGHSFIRSAAWMSRS
eukprot:scaffold230398_cov35-Tisochrysis_lutea.AAC.2